VVQQANARRSYDVQPVTREGLAEQQKIADAFQDEKLIPKRIDAVNVEVWAPGN
jgi:sulfonate transport system substrate-binding protein